MMKCIFSINSTVYSESDYIFYYLDELMKITSNVYLCISCFAEEKLKKAIGEYGLPVYEYESYIDVNRWKDVIVNHIGQVEIARTKELFLVNDSMFGPFWALTDICEHMRQRYYDFWGMTKHSSMQIGKLHYPAHIQSYFLCINKKMLADKRFWNYWRNLTIFETYEKASSEFEFKLTKKFEKMGYVSGAYVDTTDMENENPNYFISYILFGLYKLVSEKKFPFIPKFIFEIEKKEMLNYHDGDDLRRVIEYVRDNSTYNIELIFKNIVKRMDLNDLISRLNLYFILDDNEVTCEHVIENSAIFSYLFYEDLLEYSIDKLLLVPKEFDIFIATDSARKAKKISSMVRQKTTRIFKIVVTGGRGRDIASLLVTFKNEICKYEIIGFIHDKKSNQLLYKTIGESYNRHLWENMLYEKKYIRKILQIFKDKPEIGFLTPDSVMYGSYFHTLADSWTICYEKCVEIAEQMGLQVNLDKNKNPVSLGSCFWVRTGCLNKLFDLDLNYTDFPGEPLGIDGTISHALERIIPYVVQNEGYLTGYVSSVSQAEAEMIMHSYVLESLMRALCKGKKLDCSTFSNMINFIE